MAIVFSSGCLNRPELPYGFEIVDDVLVSSLEEVERRVPPPEFLAPYFANQEVPLNNIPNADMENWSIKWDDGTFTGDGYYEGGSSLQLAQGITYAPVILTATSPLFTLEHEYISFYSRGYAYSQFYSGSTFLSYPYGRIEVYDSTDTLIVSKNLVTFNTFNYAYLGGFYSGGASYGVWSNVKSDVVGEDNVQWHKITIPLPSAFIDKQIKIKLISGSLSSAMAGVLTSGSHYILFDNFYYSTSTGDEIYALESPTAQFTYVVNGYDVTVDAGISQTVGTLYQIKWNWGDGTQTTGVASEHTYNFPGNKQITLTIMDNENLVDTATLTVSVDGSSYYAGPQGSNTTNLPPIAGFSYALTGMTITVDGSYTKDDGTISLYSWDFDGVKKNGITATHTYTNAGSKTVTLIVKDNLGVENERKITFDLPIGGVVGDTIVVDNPGKPPTAKFTYTFTTPTVTVDASGSSDDVKIETYTWDWGDGSTSVGKTQSHTYSDMGTSRKIVLTVKDNEGFTDSAEIMIVTQSYNEPVDDDDDTPVVTPPTISGDSTPSNSGGSSTTAQPFPVWGAVVTLGSLLVIATVLFLAFGGKGKKKRVLNFKKGGKRK